MTKSTGQAAKRGPLDIFKSHYVRLLILGLVGISLLVLGSSMNRSLKTGTKGGSQEYGLKKEEEDLARQIQDIVSTIKGVGKVEVAVKLTTGPEHVYAKNSTISRTQSTERSGSDEREHVTQNESSQPVTGRLGGTDSVLVERVEAVKVAGCLVVAEGASSSKVKLAIYRAVETLLGVPVNKIQVVPMKGGG